MNTCVCADIVHDLSHMLYATDESIDPAMIAHIAACPTCRGALIILLADLVDFPPMPSTITCATCAVDMAAYVDCELDFGLQTARETYPHVWWHLWLCPDCAVAYQATRQLAQATQAGTLDLPPLPRRLATAWYTTHVPQGVLAQVQRAASVWGPLRSTERSDPQVVVCDHHDQYSIEVALQPHGHTQWDVFVQIDPPMAGIVQLAWDTDQQHMALDDHGQAQISNVSIDVDLLPADSKLIVTVIAPEPDP